jgi:hypothetical protein
MQLMRIAKQGNELMTDQSTKKAVIFEQGFHEQQ